MRLMLGTDGSPSLLVEVGQQKSPIEFNFEVVNGNWEGFFNNGYISVFNCPGGDFTSLEQLQILTDNQDRLRGEYDVVFNNFHDVNYIAPKPLSPLFRYPDLWDDDIPF